jgi:hypothetical protein
MHKNLVMHTGVWNDVLHDGDGVLWFCLFVCFCDQEEESAHHVATRARHLICFTFFLLITIPHIGERARLLTLLY